jgi:uncharacterized protein YcgL (UPF0745 family)
MKSSYYTMAIPILKYWISVSRKALEEGDIEKSKHAIQSAEYFIQLVEKYSNKECEIHQPIT